MRHENETIYQNYLLRESVTSATQAVEQGAAGEKPDPAAANAATMAAGMAVLKSVMTLIEAGDKASLGSIVTVAQTAAAKAEQMMAQKQPAPETVETPDEAPAPAPAGPPAPAPAPAPGGPSVAQGSTTA